eukprot:NODE_2_length_91304_cov_0.692462.p55 type:complete len:181 gc:universal NODE_2_length_91304_cov_0.692462:28644-28102(-)
MNTFQVYKVLSRVFPSKSSVILTNTIRELVDIKNRSLRSILLGKSRFDCDGILYKSNLTELKNELRSIRQTEHVGLNTQTTQIHNNLLQLGDELKQEMSNLKSDMQIEMNNRKNEIREELNILEMRTQEVNNKLEVHSSEVKTEIERMKLDVTSAISFRTVVVVTVLVFIYTKFIKKDKK